MLMGEGCRGRLEGVDGGGVNGFFMWFIKLCMWVELIVFFILNIL